MVEKQSRKFVAVIGLGLLFGSLGVGMLTYDMVVAVSTRANIEDRNRTQQVVRSALNATQVQLAGFIDDNSVWDEAFDALYGRTNLEWFMANYGFATQSGSNYNVVLVIDHNHDTVVAGVRNGLTFQPTADDYFHGKLDTLLDLMPKDTTTSASKSSVLNTLDGLALVAAGPILPSSPAKSVPTTTPLYFVFLKFLTPAVVSAVGKQYVINDFRLYIAGNGEPSDELIRGIDGAPVAYARWTDMRPGDIAGSAVRNKAMLVLGLLFSVLGFVAIQLRRLIGTIHLREADAQYRAMHDTLTELPNRMALRVEMDKLSRPGSPAMVLAFADLDGFKEVNDTYDHATGDRLIQKVAAKLIKLSNGRCTVYRLGGDEFVMLFSGADAQATACSFAKEFISSLEFPIDLGGNVVSVGVSIGIASNEDEVLGTSELMRRADVAMYEAKENGRNRFIVFASAHDAERIETQKIAEELRQIIDEKTIEIAYQPIIDVRSNSIVCVEALARWPSASSRYVSPERFVQVAEISGLIDDLSETILAKACAAARQWSGIRLAVNISPAQLRTRNFVTRVLRTIRDNGMDASNVEMEITEGALIDDVEKAQSIFSELRAAGIKIALDDFGTGYSSVGYLRQFEFNRIKIDRSLVVQVLLGPKERNVVKGIMLLAAGHSATVTAEGVEFAEQVDLLRLCGCNEMQGFYFFKPMPAKDISRILRMRPTPADLPAAA